ncbi:MAG: tetratricopeptide repeat protein [Desulfomonile tiedjei]|nr:tetratricopeptide repeat protein [Desulfomonile tiedjei]
MRRNLWFLTCLIGLAWYVLSVPCMAHDVYYNEAIQEFGQMLQHGRFADALPVACRLLEMAEKDSQGDRLNMGTALSALAGVYTMLERYKEAKPLLERALPILEQEVGRQHYLFATMLEALAGAQAKTSRFDEAEASFREVIRIREGLFGADDDSVGIAYYNLGVALIKARKYEQAREPLTRALEIKEKALGPDHPKLEEPLDALAQACWMTDDTEKAIEYEDRSRKLRAKSAAKAQESAGSEPESAPR